jgi:hypothetical protein
MKLPLSETVAAFNQLYAEKSSRTFVATLLDRDGQPLATGLAFLDTPVDSGLFQPMPETLWDSPTDARSLRDSDGVVYPLLRFYRCREPDHYHFVRANPEQEKQN